MHHVSRVTVMVCALLLICSFLTPETAYSFVRSIDIDGRPVSINPSDSKDLIEKSLVPSGRDSKDQLTCSEIRSLAEEYLLFKETETNPQLGFVEGDISYWCDEKLGERRIRLEFAARRIVLEAAEEQGVVIPDHGKLSWAAQEVISDIINEQRRLRDKKSVDNHR